MRVVRSMFVISQLLRGTSPDARGSWRGLRGGLQPQVGFRMAHRRWKGFKTMRHLSYKISDCFKRMNRSCSQR